MFEVNGLTKRLDTMEGNMVRLVTAVERLVELQEEILTELRLDSLD